MSGHFTIGDKIGFLTVLRDTGQKNTHSTKIFECLCDCGNFVNRTQTSLISAISKSYKNTSCGCMKSNQSVELVKARLAGERYYFTGIPCLNGHIANRLVSSKACIECNKEKDLASRSSRLDYFKDYQKKNPEKAKAACAKYNEANREKRREQDRLRKQNPETKAKRAAYERARRQNKRAGGGDIKKSDIDFLYLSQKGCCASCVKKLDKFHVDHIMPLYLGGNSDLTNLQILCPDCNLKKGKMHPQEWALKNGRLF